MDHSITTQGCLDDSDCVPLGHKFACFFYKCLNWVDKYVVSYSSLTFGHNKPSTDGGSTRGVAWSSRFAIMKNKHGQTPYSNCSQACFLHLSCLCFLSFLVSCVWQAGGGRPLCKGQRMRGGGPLLQVSHTLMSSYMILKTEHILQDKIAR